MGSVSNTCDECSKYFRINIAAKNVISCPFCAKKVWKLPKTEYIFDACIFCECTRFYRQKNFSPVIGLSLILGGAVLVPWTYGLSLPALFLFDVLLRRWIGEMAVCYRCRGEYRGISLREEIKPFDHHMAAMFEEGY